MSLLEEYNNTDYLEDTSFIAGSYFILEFELWLEGGQILETGGSTMMWLLSPYGQPEICLLEKRAASSGSGVYTINLESSDTATLGGTYLQQVEITDVSGKKHRPAQGIIIIRKAIPHLL